MATILSWNIEDLRRHFPGGSSVSLEEIVRKHGCPEIVCLQEVRIRPIDDAATHLLHQALPGYVCGASLCCDAINVKVRGGRMYGVATYVRSDLDPEHRSLADDREGRLIVSELPSLGVALLNVYAVNGTSKPYYDHDLGAFAGDRHAFKRRFIERVLHVCQSLLARGLKLILAGDWNVSQTKQDTYPRLRTEEPHALARQLFAENFVDALDLVDVWRHLHPETRA